MSGSEAVSSEAVASRSHAMEILCPSGGDQAADAARRAASASLSA